MEFDKTRVYTSVNADEVKVGSKGFFADDLESLKCRVEDGVDIFTVREIQGDCCAYRFKSGASYALFYPVGEPEPKEVTASEWDNRPRLMSVWDDDYSNIREEQVVYIIPDEEKASHPVVAYISHHGNGGHITWFKHCAEIVVTKEAYVKYQADGDYGCPANFASELADIIRCVAIIAKSENIDLDRVVADCLEKNHKRAEGIGDKK